MGTSRYQLTERPLRKHLVPILLLEAACLFTLALSPGEISALEPAQAAKRSVVLKVRGDRDFPPYEYMDEEGEPTGFNVELFRAVAEVMGLEAEIRLEFRNEVRSDLESGRIDAATGMFYSPKKEPNVDFSVPHSMVYHAIFVRHESDIRSVNDLKGREIIVQRGDVMNDFVAGTGITNKIITAETHIDALRLLASGKYDCALLAKFQGAHLARQFGLDNIESIDLPLEPQKFCFAVPEGRTQLLETLNEGLRILKQTGRYNDIYDKWFGILEPRKTTFGDVIRYAGFILIPLVAILLAMIAWSWTLRRRVKLKTDQLRLELEERARIQEALKKSEASYRLLFDRMLDAFAYCEVLTDEQGKVTDVRFLEVNPAFENITGKKARQAVGKTAYEVFSGANQFWGEAFRQVAETGAPMTFERYADTLDKYFKVSIFRPEKGFLGINFIDITDRKRAEERLRLTEFSVENTSIPTFWVGADGSIINANKAAAGQLGYAREELLQMKIWEIDPSYSGEHWPERWKNLKEKQFLSTESRHRTRDGKIIPVEIHANFFEYEGREYDFAFVRDISESTAAREEIIEKNQELESLNQQLRASEEELSAHYNELEATMEQLAANEEELQRRNKELQDAMIVKTEFVSMVSHELRTPLVPILGYSELLLSGDIAQMPPEAIKPLHAIKSRAEALRNLIEDLLTISRLERGKMEVDIQPLPLRKHLLETVADYRRMEHAKPVQIRWEGQGFEVLADHLRFHQVMQNLVGNAIKYSGASVEIVIRTSIKDARGLICVSDNGIGIAPEHLPRIFDRFFQAEKVDTRAHGGTGLGLAITRELVELMGGEIQAGSELGKGSVFTVALPLAGGQDPEDRAGDWDPGHGASRKPQSLKSILVFDDDQNTIDSMERMLGEQYRILSASSLGQGIELMRSFNVELIMLDWEILGLDGLEALRILKSDEIAARVPIVLLSSETKTDFAKKVYKEGKAEIISKPFSETDMNKIKNILDKPV